jgi:hypothetical protein
MIIGGSVKRLFILLLVMALGAGMVFATANPSHPPGAPALEMALPGYGVDFPAFTPGTVLAMAPHNAVTPGQFLAIPVFNGSAGLPQRDIMIKPYVVGQGLIFVPPKTTDYPMLC